jgi:hypothetical protein
MGNLQKNVSVIYEENEESKSKSKILIQSLPFNPSSSNEAQQILQNQLSGGPMPKSGFNDLRNTNKVLHSLVHAAVEEVDDEGSENVEHEEHKKATPTPLNLLKAEDV